ncbi:1903_t:CDS:2, partial [Acaulospora colombiana]
MMNTKMALTSATTSNGQYAPSSKPVGLFFGGTSGIGQAMAEQLAKQTNGRAHIILLGRNEAAAEKIIASFPKTDASTAPEDASDYSFVKLDATSMEQVRQVTSQLSSQLPKINFIITTPGYLTLKGRDETSEGIDRKLACNFYARFRFIHDLAPLVAKAAQNGERTGVMSILGAGHGGPVNLDDLGLVKTYTLGNAAAYAITCTDAVMQEFASKYPTVPFYHAFPGTVSSPMMTTLFPGARFFAPLLKPWTVTPAQCAEIMWWRLWSSEAQWKTGAHEIDNKGTGLTPNQHVTEESKKAIWDHAISTTDP